MFYESVRFPNGSMWLPKLTSFRVWSKLLSVGCRIQQIPHRMQASLFVLACLACAGHVNSERMRGRLHRDHHDSQTAVLFDNLEQLQPERQAGTSNMLTAIKMLLTTSDPPVAWQFLHTWLASSTRSPAQSLDIPMRSARPLMNPRCEDDSASYPSCEQPAGLRNGRRQSIQGVLLGMMASFMQQPAFAYKVQDYVEAGVDLPLRPEEPLTILMPFGALKKEDVAEVKKGDAGDRTGAYMWPGGIDLARGASTGKLRMSQDESIKSVPVQGKRVLELGCGTGVVGIAAAIGGASSVLLTDANPELIVNTQKNIDRNLKGSESSKVTTQRLRWGNEEDEARAIASGPFDVILSSETAYERSVFPLLFGCMKRIMEAARREGVKSPVAVLQQDDVFADIAKEGDTFRGVKGVLQGAKKAGLRIVATQEVGETVRIVLSL